MFLKGMTKKSNAAVASRVVSSANSAKYEKGLAGMSLMNKKIGEKKKDPWGILAWI